MSSDATLMPLPPRSVPFACGLARSRGSCASFGLRALTIDGGGVTRASTWSQRECGWMRVCVEIWVDI